MSTLSENSQHYDFHSHSSYSDGALSPTELLQHAKARHVSHLALTDHDTVLGLAEARAAACVNNIQLISGVELSASWQGFEIHVVALNVDETNTRLLEYLKQQNRYRRVRGQAIAEALAVAGIRDTFADAEQLAREGNITRPHFAQVLVQRGHAKSIQQAFTRYLKRGKPAYVSAKWPNLERTVQVIHSAGGLAVLAHPLRYSLTMTKLRLLLDDFKAATGDGLEVVTASQVGAESQKVAQLAVDYDLLASQGSDFHAHDSYANLGQLTRMPTNCEPIWNRLFA